MSKKLVLIALLLVCAFAGQKLVTEEFSEQGFTNTAVSGWTVTGSNLNQLTSVCGDRTLFGGFNVFGSGAAAVKNFNSQVDHHELVVSFDLYTIDTWDNELFKVFIDDVEVFSLQAYLGDSTPRVASCGLTTIDRLNTVGFSVKHFRRDFTIKFTSTLDQVAADESWGIRNLQILANFNTDAIKVVSEEFIQSKGSSISGWTFTGVTVGQELTTCGSANLLGGYNSFAKGSTAQKTYQNLADHVGIIITFDLWFVDSVDGTDFVDIVVDSQVYRYYRPSTDTGLICGVTNWYESVRKVSIYAPHRNSQFTFLIRSGLDQVGTDESFGLQNLRILTHGCPSTLCQSVVSDFEGSSQVTPQNWTYSGTKQAASTVQNCKNEYYLGGFNSDVQKKVTSLPSHHGVRVYFTLVKQGTWNSNTYLRFLINDAYVIPEAQQLVTTGPYCTSGQDQIWNVILDVAHFQNVFQLRFIPFNFGSDTKFSVKNLVVYTYNIENQKVSANDFTTDLQTSSENWDVIGNNSGYIASVCGTTELFGGYNVFGFKTAATRVFDNLLRHSFLKISFRLYFIDTWDNEYLSIWVDGEFVKKYKKTDPSSGSFNLCGMTNALEEIIVVEVIVPHNNSSVTLKLVDNLDQAPTDESWGIRDVYVSALTYRSVEEQLDGACDDSQSYVEVSKKKSHKKLRAQH